MGHQAVYSLALVHEHGAKVADDVDDAEDEAGLGEHGEVGGAHVVAQGRVLGRDGI